jgi:SAM-dependent methyltransferase
MPNLSDAEILQRYRTIYNLDDSIDIEQARKHWDVERKLTQQLLNSAPGDRWELFSKAYSQLYSELPWLNKADETDRERQLSQWDKLIPVPARIFEVGSGKAELLKHLASIGHDCTATEITSERGKRHAPKNDKLAWHLTDGIHLADFEPNGHYDIVISTGVIEHFHPDDIVTHFAHARKILREGGRYIFTTPHIASGPHDLSRAFGHESAVCMHLREYDYPSLHAILREAGYARATAVFPPSRIYRKLNWTKESRTYLAWLEYLDRGEAALKLSYSHRQKLRKFMKLCLMPDNIWLSATA